jgi:transposase
MRAADAAQTLLFPTTQVEDRIPQRHPLRAVRSIAVDVGAELRPFLDQIYKPGGSRPAPAPEQILRALLLWSLYGIRSEPALLEDLDFNLLYRWFVGLGPDDRVWPLGTFKNNRRRILGDPAGREFFARVYTRIPRRLVAHGRFAVDWPLVEAWSGQRRLADLSDAANGRI